MRMPLIAGFVMGVLIAGTVPAAQQDDKAAFEATKRKISDLHASLISHAAPPVQARIRASAAATTQYLSSCGRTCNLSAFMSRDLKGRFTRLTSRELDLLVGLVFAETAATDSEQVQLRLNDLFQKHDQAVATLQKVLSGARETQVSILSNIKP